MRIAVDPAGGGGNTNLIQRRDCALSRLAFGNIKMLQHRLAQLFADLQERVQRG